MSKGKGQSKEDEPADDVSAEKAVAPQDRLKKADRLYRQKVYPEAQAIFGHVGKSPEEMISTCLVFIDTNALVLPYSAGKKESLAEIRGMYKKLAREQRLIIPGQVAREFADIRAVKLSELYQQLAQKESATFEVGASYTLLEGIPEYKGLQESAKAARQALDAYRSKIGELIKVVRGWSWNDPVSMAYAEAFKGCVHDPNLDAIAIQKKLAFNTENRLPPGYKDAGKEDDGIGDLLIWHTILDVAETRKADALFVTGEEKADWWHRHSKTTLYPRFELVDEYRRKSGGKAFAMCALSDLLRLMQANQAAIEDVRETEQARWKTDLVFQRWVQQIVEDIARVDPLFLRFVDSVRNLSPEEIDNILRAAATDLERLNADPGFKNLIMQHRWRLEQSLHNVRPPNPTQGSLPVDPRSTPEPDPDQD